MELGLGRVKRALAELDLPPPGVPIVQVLGTNGKGSTCAFLAELARDRGLKTGLYASPHFLSPRERIKIDGVPASEEMWLTAANEIFAVCPGAGELTYFEFLTVLALAIFRREEVEAYILEAGLGGRNDATSAIPAGARCFAPIGVDHAAVIGPTIADIASDKAAAIEPGVPNFSAPQFPLAAAILRRAAGDDGIVFVEPLTPRPLALAGKHQLTNAALALACARSLWPEADEAALARAFLPGRLQTVRLGEGKEFLLDGAHNPHAVASLIACTRETRTRPDALIFSCLKDKDWKPSLAMLARAFPRMRIFFAPLANERAESPEALASFLKRAYPERAARIAPLTDCLRLSGEGATLLTGSLYLLAEFYALYPQHLRADANEV